MEDEKIKSLAARQCQLQSAMATNASPKVLLLSASLVTLLVLSFISNVGAQSSPTHHTKRNHGKFTPGPWSSAHATFYGGSGGSQTTAGACGYSDTVSQGYGLQTAAVSSTLYNNGNICGACFEIKCIAKSSSSPQWCKSAQSSILVTATNWCPPNYALASDNGGWCNPPRVHFDLSMPAFLQIAEYKAGIVPINYRRVPCRKQGGIRFTMNGHRYYVQVMVWNVGGAGDVQRVEVRGSKQVWVSLRRDWGQRWVTGEDLTGQSLSFRVTTSDKRRSTSFNITPQNWQFGQTYEGKNFKY